MSAPYLHLTRPERRYVVSRTLLVVPGRPFIVAECAAGSFSSAGGLESFTRAEMERDPTLAEALRAWDAEDDSLSARDARAQRRIARAGRQITASEIAARAAHPSSLARRWQLGTPPEVDSAGA